MVLPQRLRTHTRQADAERRVILLTAATPWEVRPIARSLALNLQPKTTYRYDGRILNEEIVLLETGIGMNFIDFSRNR